jgi:hypothetical protein
MQFRVPQVRRDRQPAPSHVTGQTVKPQ